MKMNLAVVLSLCVGAAVQAAPLELKKGDHISLIGNTLAERMQHHGWLETLIYSRFPQHELVFRNLGFSGDELTVRLRSANFGSPDDWLSKTKTDVVFAFFGYNESFGGPLSPLPLGEGAGVKGLDKFKTDLDNFVKTTLKQKYNGQAPPRLVLFSPMAHEDLKDPHLPDGRDNNERLKHYAAAMAAVAGANDVPFVDLFGPTSQLYAASAKPLTINGIHLNEHGDKLVAEVIERALFGDNAKHDARALEKLRQAILDKNFYWFNRYRTVDGYSIFGGRADLKFTEIGSKKINTNREIAQREMEILDVMTANRDRRVWAVAQGGDLKVDDSNTPPFIDIKTNKPGTLPDGKHSFLSGEEAIDKMKPGKGLKINLFASEKEFPDLANPVQMAWDSKGRLFVAVMPSYPHWKPKEEMNDKIIILEDTNGDGRADKCTVFADRLHVPTGLEFYNGGLLVGQQPDLMFLKDTDGDDRADVRERVLHGIDSADTHHALNSFVVDGGGALYFQEGTFHHTQVETPWGPPVRCANAGVFRFEPRTYKFEVYVNYGFANPHGHVFDRWGQDFVTDGTGAVNYFAAAFSGRTDYPQRHSGLKPFFPQKTRPCPATEFLSSSHFPEEFQGNYLIGNVIGFLGILRYKMKDDGSGFGADELEPIVSATDPNFRPADLEIGPDGALYFLDWQNPIIGHMQHNLRDPNRDRTHGRVYRVTYEGRPLLKPARIAGEPIVKLLDLLKSPEDRVRYRARLELSSRKGEEVIAALTPWMDKLDRQGPGYEHHLLEALWLHQNHNLVNRDLLKRVLSSADYRARAAGARVLCYWRDQVSDALELFKGLAADAHPRVRLEAVRAASFFNAPEAVEVALIAAEHPTDYYLDYTSKETMRTLEPYWKAAMSQGRSIGVTTEAGARFFLRNTSLEQLLKMKSSPTTPFGKSGSTGVDWELVYRPGVRDELRREAVAALAKADNKSDLGILMLAIARIDSKKEERDESVAFDLVRLLASRGPKELGLVRGEIEKWATAAKQPTIRQIGFMTLIAIDGSAEAAWALALRSPFAMRDLLASVPLIADASLRASLYPKIEPLLTKLPPSLATKAGKGTLGRYVRIELPGKATLTLAEVEVYSDGRNVARLGKASQKNTGHGGEAKRAIDGNKSGNFSDGGQSHSQENTANPWWEVDLGQEFPIESIVVYNRTDGILGKRLRGFNLKVLDEKRGEVFRQDRNAAPAPKSAFDLAIGVGPGQLRQAAMTALTAVRGQETKTFQTLAQFLPNPDDRPAAIRAIQRIKRTYWPKEKAQPLLDLIVPVIRKIPPKDRTTPAALEALEFADALASLLPAGEAKKIRAELGQLGVRVIRLGTLPERMAYDREVLVVEAGKPVEFLFENFDLMPHNFVITAPGALEELGKLAEATATSPDAQARHFVPKSDKVLLASLLLQPRETQKLSFIAPKKPGVYPYVCTYPGHWMRMHGALYVVADMEQYLASPDAYLAQHQLPIHDPLLKDRRPRTEWKYDDLAGAVAELKAGRSYGNGKQMFQVATCVACHQLDGVGTNFAPELAKLDPKLTPTDILRDLLEPSFRINDKYQTYVFQTAAGKTITGVILEENKTIVKVIENPLAKPEPIILKVAEIESRQKSPVSVMPKGLLDKLTREEVLDLLAYIIARGNRQHPLFRNEGAAAGGHHQH